VTLIWTRVYGDAARALVDGLTSSINDAGLATVSRVSQQSDFI
jgi:hypothetical protein